MTTRLIIPIFFLFAGFPGIGLSLPFDGGSVRLRPGFQHIIDFPDARRVSIGNPDIIEAQPLPKHDGILVVGKKVGETDLVVWGKTGKTEWKVNVYESRVSEIEEVKGLASLFPGLSVADTGDSLVISGTVGTTREKTLLEDYARTRQKVHLSISLPEEKKTLLSYNLKIIEISKGASTQLGVRWPDSVSAKGSFSSGNTASPVFTMVSDFEARLNLLMADGRARILANPQLVCESGESAEFLAGGEIPIVIVTPETRTVEWKNYGIILKLHPKMDLGNRIRTQISAEISTIDHGSGGSEVPGFLTRRVTTHFSTLPGATVMISGLVKSEMAKDVAKVPLLGHIPILGELFKSRSFRENQSELAIFITPSEAKENYETEFTSWQKKSSSEHEGMKFRILD